MKFCYIDIANKFTKKSTTNLNSKHVLYINILPDI